MNKRLLEFTFMSIKHRWKQIVRACLAAFFAVFFVTAVLIFEENMFEWQVASNKERFGNWFVMETNREKQSDQIKNNPKITKFATASSAVKIYDEELDFTNCCVGYMPPEFIKIGCIEPTQGKMPDADNEIAIDRNTLMKLGITNPEVGQTITIRYYDNNKQSESNLRTEEFILTGILEDYTNIWRKGSELPGALVTKKRYDEFACRYSSVHIYKLATDIRNVDYQAIYQDMIEGSSLKPVYNSYVYDYKAWGDEAVYEYMYILVMIIGIAALTYQLIAYKNSRKNTYSLMRMLGASRSQIMTMTFVENVIILLPSGLAGIIGAALTGKLICFIIEANMGIGFYYLNLEILAKGLMAILIAVIVEVFVSRILTIRQVLAPKRASIKKDKNVKVNNRDNHKKYKQRLNSANAIRKISFRFTRANKLAQNFGLRIFSLTICVVILICGCKIYDAYDLYNKNKDNLDLIGIDYQDKEFTLKVPYYILNDNQKYSEWSFLDAVEEGKIDISDVQISPTQEQINKLLTESFAIHMGFEDNISKVKLSEDKSIIQSVLGLDNGLFYRTSDVNFTTGFSLGEVEIIENLVGVKDVSYSTYESQRAWTWSGMSLEKMGYKKLQYEKVATMASPQPYGSRYLFATEYVNPTQELYDKISKYIEPEMVDYEAFCRGEQALVFITDNPYGEYDDTLKAGTTINYHYYDLPITRYDISKDKETQNIFSYDEAYFEYTYNILYTESDYNKNMLNTDLYDYSDWIWDENGESERRAPSKQCRVMNEPCVQTKAAGVVYVTEEIEKEFADIISQYGYYTAIASNTLAEQACENQNKMLADLAGVSIDELPDDCKAKVLYNKLYAKYDLMASICATDNILSKFCEENNVMYVSYADVNEQYRTNLINSFLRYGITIAAAIVINMLIGAIIAQNRLEARKERIELLLRIGAEKGGVCKIFMIEALRESLWCIFTMPIILIIQYTIYRRNIKKI